MTPSSVLVVKPSSLADIVHTLPAVHFLKSTFPVPHGRPIPSLQLLDRFVVLHPFARGAHKSLTAGEIFEFTHLLAPHPAQVTSFVHERLLQ